MAGHGRPWWALADLGRPWPAMAGLGRPWPAMAGHGRPWPALAGLGRPWPAMAGQFVFCETNSNPIYLFDNNVFCHELFFPIVCLRGQTNSNLLLFLSNQFQFWTTKGRVLACFRMAAVRAGSFLMRFGFRGRFGSQVRFGSRGSPVHAVRRFLRFGSRGSASGGENGPEAGPEA